MALTRKYLSAMGIEADKIDEIIEAHTETVNGLKAERDEFREAAEKLPKVQEQLNKANEALKAQGTDEYKEKYESTKAEFDAYKKEVSDKEITASKDKAYRQMLKDAGISEKRIDSIMRVTDLQKIELDGDKLKDVEGLAAQVKEEWADFLTTESKQGAGTDNPPPAGDDGGKPAATIPTIF